MEVTYVSKCGRFTTKCVGNEKEIFKQIAHFQEIFENSPPIINGETSDDVRFVVRNVDDNDFYEMRIVSGKLAGYALGFGSKKKGDELFPKRSKEEDGKKVWLENQGWVKFQGKKD